MSEQLSPKEILKRQKHQHDFTVYQIAFLKHLEDTIDYGNKTFTNFSVDNKVFLNDNEQIKSYEEKGNIENII